MKKLSFQLLLVLLLIVSVATLGCKKEKETVLDEAAKTEITETITQLTKEVLEAVSNQDLDKMFSTFSNDAIVIEDGEIEYSLEEAKKIATERKADIKEFKITIDEMKVDVLSADVAIICGKYSYTFTYMTKYTPGKTFKGKRAWTFVFKKENKLWKIRHSHESGPDTDE